ncbi:MAG: pentapeptide repeat-containing protein [Candidatus Bathyarchaeia archaeon]
MTQDELNVIIAEHKLWLSNTGGKRADLVNVNLIGLNMSGANMSEANMSRANMSRANMSGANMSEANMSRANMFGANMSRANMFGANMSGANMSEANMFGANMSRANMSGANMSGVNMSEADIFGVNLHGAILTGTCLDPNNTPNAIVDKFEIINGFVIGYRTKVTSHIPEYKVDNIYSADWFSTCENTECHPGLYLWPTLTIAINYSGSSNTFIKVRTKPKDVHKAGTKYRCKWFEVLEEIQVVN